MSQEAGQLQTSANELTSLPSLRSLLRRFSHYPCRIMPSKPLGSIPRVGRNVTQSLGASPICESRLRSSRTESRHQVAFDELEEGGKDEARRTSRTDRYPSLRRYIVKSYGCQFDDSDSRISTRRQDRLVRSGGFRTDSSVTFHRVFCFNGMREREIHLAFG